MASRYKRHVYVCKRAYSCPRIELERPPRGASFPRFSRRLLVLVDTVHLDSGGNQGRHGYRVGDCSAEKAERGWAACSVRGALGGRVSRVSGARVSLTLFNFIPICKRHVYAKTFIKLSSP